MQFRQKLAYMALGGGLVLAGHVLPGLVVGSATAQAGLQDAEFNEVTVRKLTVVDESSGMTVVNMMATASGGLVGVYQPDGNRVAVISAEPDGGAVVVYQPDGTEAAIMMAAPNGGGVGVYQPDGTAVAAISAEPKGGFVGVYQPDGTTAVGITADSDGGIITVRQPEGSTAASMGVSPQGGGMMIVMDPEGSTAAGMMSLVKDGEAVGGSIEVYAPPGWDSELRAPVRLTVDKYGGRVNVYGKGGGSSRAVLAVNEYGNGAVSTWDKNGYRQ